MAVLPHLTIEPPKDTALALRQSTDDVSYALVVALLAAEAHRRADAVAALASPRAAA